MTEFSTEQQEAIDLVLKGMSVFLTGQAGTGKSRVVHAVKERFEGKVALLAPTGIAASNIGGQTIHAFFKMGINFGTTHRNKDTINATELIIIDEVSMITPDLFARMNEYLQQYYLECNPCHDPNTLPPPFGGKQILLVGDFYQLPPVKKDNSSPTPEDLICFSQDWHSLNPVEVRLTKVFRQQGDAQFLDLLSRAREGAVSQQDLVLLNALRGKAPNADAVRLVYTNDRLKFVNEEELKKVDKADIIKFSANYLQYPYVKKVVERLINTYPYDAEVALFVNAKVVMLRNNHPDYSNGSVGYVTKIIQEPLSDSEPPAAVFVKINGVEHEVRKVVFETVDDTGNELSWAQFPLRLAYAMTVHKAQGQTFESIVIDRQHLSYRGNWFKLNSKNHGQLYTALSRAKSLDGVCFMDYVDANDFYCMFRNDLNNNGQ